MATRFEIRGMFWRTGGYREEIREHATAETLTLQVGSEKEEEVKEMLLLL